MVDAKKTDESKASEKTEAPKTANKSAKEEEGMFGGVATVNNPKPSELAYDGRKDDEKK